MSLFTTLLPQLTREPASAETSVKPRFEVAETPEAYRLTVQLPGVAKDGLELTAEGGELRIVGRRGWNPPEGWTSLYRESSAAAYELVLSYEQAVDAEKIQADLKDGILRVTLPKAESLKPRKIAVS